MRLVSDQMPDGGGVSLRRVPSLSGPEGSALPRAHWVRVLHGWTSFAHFHEILGQIIR